MINQDKLDQVHEKDAFKDVINKVNSNSMAVNKKVGTGTFTKFSLMDDDSKKKKES